MVLQFPNRRFPAPRRLFRTPKRRGIMPKAPEPSRLLLECVWIPLGSDVFEDFGKGAFRPGLKDLINAAEQKIEAAEVRFMDEVMTDRPPAPNWAIAEADYFSKCQSFATAVVKGIACLY